MKLFNKTHTHKTHSQKTWPHKLSVISAVIVALSVFTSAMAQPPGPPRQRLQQFWAEIPPSKKTLESPNVPRTHDGLPDIFGQWRSNWRTLAPNNLHDRKLTEKDQIQQKDFATEADYLDWVNRDLNTSPSVMCIPNGAARFFSNPYLVEFFRTGEHSRYDQILAVDEIYHGMRHFFMDPNVEIEPNKWTRGNWGVSKGQWQDRSGDGKVDMLVVETVGLTANWIDQTGLTHDDGATLTEEFWLNDDGSILHMLWTLTDPKTYAHPIKQHFWWNRPSQDDSPIFEEYICSFDSAEPEQYLERFQK